MNREDIITWAREAGFVVDEASKQYQPKCIGFTHYLIDDELERFAALVAAAERKVIMDSLQKQADLANDALDRRWALEMIAAVAVRGETK